MPQLRRIHRAAAVAAVMLLLAGCAGTPSGKAVSGEWGSKAAGQPYLNIQEDGTFSGTDGCNQLSGQGQIDGNEITFGSITSTMKACQGVDEWLAHAATGNVRGDTMTVLNDGGKTIGTLKRSGA